MLPSMNFGNDIVFYSIKTISFSISINPFPCRNGYHTKEYIRPVRFFARTCSVTSSRTMLSISSYIYVSMCFGHVQLVQSGCCPRAASFLPTLMTQLKCSASSRSKTTTSSTCSIIRSTGGRCSTMNKLKWTWWSIFWNHSSTSSVVFMCPFGREHPTTRWHSWSLVCLTATRHFDMPH